MQTTARRKIPYPDLSGDDTPVDLPQLFHDRAVILDAGVDIDMGTLAQRPTSTSGTPGIAGRQFVVTDQPGGNRLDLDIGAGWVTVGPFQVDAAPNVASLRTLGAGANQAAAGNDPRLIGGGNASGDLTGVYPGPMTVATWNGQSKAAVVAGSPPQSHGSSHLPAGSDPIVGLTDASIAAANKDGAANLPSMRTLGAGAQQAMAGNATPTPGAHAAQHKYNGSDPLVLLKPTVQNANYAAAVDDYVLMSGSNNTVTLPNAPSVDGAACAVMAITAGVVVNRAGTDTITTSAQGQLTVTVAQGTTVIFTYHNGVWYGLVTGGGSGASGLVALSPPSRAHLATTWANPAGAYAKVPLDTKDFDPIGAFDVTTNHRFTVQTAGYYLIEGFVATPQPAQGVLLTAIAAIYKNGAFLSNGPRVPESDLQGWINAPVSDVVQLNAGDYVELWFYGNAAWTGSGGTAWMSVTQVAQTGSPPAGQGLNTAARAHRQAAFAGANGVQKVPLDTIEFDPGSNLQIANNRYICPATGYYQCNGQVMISAGVGAWMDAIIYKNGAPVASGNSEYMASGDSADLRANVSDIVFCQAGDYLELWWQQNAAYSLDAGGVSGNFFSVVQVAGSSVFGALSPTAQNAPYTAGAGQLVLMTGANAVTLPNGPIPGSQVEVQALTAQVPVNRAGTDTINNAGVAGLQSLTVNAGQSVIFSYLGGVWYASPVGAGQSLAPPMRVGATALANVTAAAWTKVPLSTKAFDAGGNYDNTTNFRYVAPSAGLYEVAVNLGLNATAAGQSAEVAIYKNGAAVTYGPTVEAQASGFVGSSTSDVLQLNAGDYVEMWGFSSAALGFLGGAGDVRYNFMAINQVGVIGAPTPGQGQATVARMYRTAAFNIPAGAWTKLPFETVDYDPGHNTVIGSSRYVCPTTGYFEVDAELHLTAVANSQTIVSIYKNGAEVSRGNAVGAADGHQTFTAGDVISCNAGDYIETYCYSTNGQALPAGGGSVNFMSVRQIAGTNLVGALSPTAQSAPYSAGGGQNVLVTGANTQTLPNAPMGGTEVAVDALTAAVTVNRSGTDTIYSGLSSYVVPQGATCTFQYLNGVWYPRLSLPGALSNFALVSVLPANPVDGQICYLNADATNGVIWTMRYNAAWAGDAHKWQFVGGDPMWVDQGAAYQPAAGAGTWVGNYQPAITAPFTGLYMVDWKMTVWNTLGSGAAQVYCGLDTSANPNSIQEVGASTQATVNANVIQDMVMMVRITVAAGVTIRTMLDISVNNALQFLDGAIRIRPLRLG